MRSFLTVPTVSVGGMGEHGDVDPELRAQQVSRVRERMATEIAEAGSDLEQQGGPPRRKSTKLSARLGVDVQELQAHAGRNIGAFRRIP
jgi:hypothetical protein